MQPTEVKVGPGRQGNEKLTAGDIPEILRMAEEGQLSRVIAARFGVCRSAISHVLTGRTWKHVPRPAVRVGP